MSESDTGQGGQDMLSLDFDSLKESNSVKQRINREDFEKAIVFLGTAAEAVWKLMKRSQNLRITLDYDAEAQKVKIDYDIISLRHDNQQENSTPIVLDEKEVSQIEADAGGAALKKSDNFYVSADKADSTLTITSDIPENFIKLSYGKALVLADVIHDYIRKSL